MAMKFVEGGDICRIESGFEDGKLVYRVYTGSDTEQLSDLTKEEQDIVLRWLHWNLWPAKGKCEGHSSYGMKHLLEHRTGIYLTNNAFKSAMLRLGFFPCKVNELNWTFRVKRNSPMFQMQVDGHCGMPMLGGPMVYAKGAREGGMGDAGADGDTDGAGADSGTDGVYIKRSTDGNDSADGKRSDSGTEEAVI